MGEQKRAVFGFNFKRRIKQEFNGAKVTSGAGSLLYRELGEAFVLMAIGMDGIPLVLFNTKIK